MADGHVSAPGWKAHLRYQLGLFGGNVPRPGPERIGGPEGIAGWLLLPAVATVLAPIVELKGIFNIVVDQDRALGSKLSSATLAVVLLLGWSCALLLLVRRHKDYPFAFVVLTTTLAGIVAVGAIAQALDGGLSAEQASHYIWYIVGVGIWIGYMLRSRRVINTFTTGQPAMSSMRPSGIGGWLALPAVVLLVLPPTAILVLYSTARAVFWRGIGEDNWFKLLFLVGSPIGAMANGRPSLVLCELAAVVALFVLWASTVYLAVQRRRLFATMFVATCLVFLVESLGEVLMFASTGGASIARAFVILAWPVLACTIAVPYVLRSARVRNTFVA